MNLLGGSFGGGALAGAPVLNEGFTRHTATGGTNNVTLPFTPTDYRRCFAIMQLVGFTAAASDYAVSRVFTSTRYEGITNNISGHSMNGTRNTVFGIKSTDTTTTTVTVAVPAGCDIILRVIEYDVTVLGDELFTFTATGTQTIATPITDLTKTIVDCDAGYDANMHGISVPFEFGTQPVTCSVENGTATYKNASFSFDNASTVRCTNITASTTSHVLVRAFSW